MVNNILNRSKWSPIYSTEVKMVNNILNRSNKWSTIYSTEVTNGQQYTQQK